MKLYKSILFIISVLAILAGICLFFPKDGFQLGGLKLQFPSLREVLSIDEEEEEEVHELTPEELLEIRMAALMQMQDSTFLDFCHNSPIRIVMPKIHIQAIDSIATDSLRQLALQYDPNTPDSLLQEIIAYRDSITDEGDLSYLDLLFSALDSARVRHVRIIHYGDSQIEEDRITSSLREHFQTQFGGYGPGLLPAVQTVMKMTVRQYCSPELGYNLAYGSAEARASHMGYGPMAQFSQVYGSATLNYRGYVHERFPHACLFDRVTLLRRDEETKQLVCDVQDFDTLQNSVKVHVDGPTHVYGVMLDSKTGVNIDNIPMRGSSGNFFSRISRSTMVPFFEHENVQCVILQYGGNSVPYLKTEASQIQFCENMQKQIHYFQELAPEARILFIGPSDMATIVRGQRATYPQLPSFVKMLEKYVTEAGAAFWNMYEAMGGEGSMVKWVDSYPQLAGEDYVHFTHKGAQQISDLLYETIDTYYKYYKFRNGELDLELPQDSVMNDSLVVDSLFNNK